ncbi:MAG: alpha-amylase family glycosyl hydrolase [Phycisphaerae bacterium]
MFRTDSDDVGVLESWYASTPGPLWEHIELPGPWERNGIDADSGAAWFRLEAPGLIVGDSDVLWLAGIDARARVWINGHEVRSVSTYPTRFAAPLAHLSKPDANIISIRVVDRGRSGNILRGAWIAPNSPSGAAWIADTKPARRSEDWVRDGVIYSAYLRSASPEGTFAGLERRLDELATLGVSILWLLPIHPVGVVGRKGSLGSPYAVRDFHAVNPEFGTLDDFRRLLAAAHQRGMKLIIDLVANHTSWDNPLIEQHPDWFSRGGDGKIRPPVPDWSDVAQLDYYKPALREWMIETLCWWVRDVGIDGFRCDVADMVPLDLWEQVRPQLDAIKPIVMLAEGDKPQDHEQAFDLTYDWWTYKQLGRLSQGTLSVTSLQHVLADEALDYPLGSLRMRFISNHDLNTWHKPAATRYRRSMRAAAVLSFTLPGVPLIYTGDEVASEARLDLFERVVVDFSSDAMGMQAHFAALSKLRRDHAALRRGAMRWYTIEHRNEILAFERTHENESVFVLINLADAQRRVQLPQQMSAATADAISTAQQHGATSVTLPPWSWWIATKA